MAGIRKTAISMCLLLCLLWSAESAAGASIQVPASPLLGTLTPGQTSTSAPSLIVVANIAGSWRLQLSLSDSSSPAPGHLVSAGGAACAGSAPTLSSPVQLTASKLLGTTTLTRSSYALSGGSAEIARGTLGDTVTVLFSQAVGSLEPVRGGCTYSIGLTWTVI